MNKIITFLSLIKSINGVVPGTIKDDGPVFNDFKLVLDANWRWLHYNGNYNNCYDGSWKCGSDCDSCLLEGVSLEQYKSVYGVSSIPNGVELQFVTGSNVGSRLYLLKDNKYWLPNLVNHQISIDVDISELPCSLNAAVYLVEMKSTENDILGIGYGDAQCPTDIKYFSDGRANIKQEAICAVEIDLIEANREAMAWTMHPCIGTNCDKSGADANSYRQGYHDFYGPHKTVDTTKPFTAITQFIGDPIVEIKRLYKQNNKIYEHPGGSLTSESIAKWKTLQQEPNTFEQSGGFSSLTDAIKRGMSFVVSIWDDPATHMKWLDSGDRGPCDGANLDVRGSYPNVKARFSNIKLESLEIDNNVSTSQSLTGQTTTSQTTTTCQTSVIKTDNICISNENYEIQIDEIQIDSLINYPILNIIKKKDNIELYRYTIPLKDLVNN